MKKLLLSVAAVAAMALCAKAEWSKSYDWDDTKDQIWTSYDNGGKHYVSTGGWEIEYSAGSGDEISITYVKTVGTSSLLNFDTIERDTGKRVVSISGFKQKYSLTDVVFPSSLATVGGSAFHSCPITSDLVFSSDHAVSIGDSAFYSTKVRSVTLKGAGSTIAGNAFSAVTSWVGTSDISGATSIGISAFQNGGNSVHPTFELIISPAVTSIGNNAFQKHRNLVVKVAQPKIISEIPEKDGTIGDNAFSDTGAALGQYFTLTIPFRGGCTVGNSAFNWMQKCNNFEFWGKAPTFSSSSFSSLGAAYNYKIRITGCPEMDPEGWSKLAALCTDAEKGRADYPGDDVCLGTYTTGSGATFWVCKGTSPYIGGTDNPVLDGVSVAKTATGYRIAGSLIQGSANIKAFFGENMFSLTDGKVAAPAQFDVELTVGDAPGQIPSGQMFSVSVVADDGSGNTDTWTSEKSVYTGRVTIEKVKDASEYRFAIGTFRISRGEGNTAGELKVSYAASGTAVADKNYEKLPGRVTIPDGSSFADIEIVPVFDEEDAEGTTLVLTLTDGDYFISQTEGEAEMFIESTDELDTNVYVDSMAESGDGSESAPVRTIREGLERAQKGFTIHVRGGEDRVYRFDSVYDQVVIPAKKSGLTIQNWGAAPAKLRVSDTYTKELGASSDSTPPILNEADSVTFKGLTFVFGKNSLAQNGYAYQAYLESHGNYTVVENCAIVGPRDDKGILVEGDRWSSGQNHGLWKLTGRDPIVRNCTIEDVRVSSTYDSYQIAPIFIGSYDFLIEGCTIRGVQRLFNNAVNNTRPNVTVVSNRFLNCICEVEATSSNGNPSDGLFRGAYTGFNNLTLAYNIFYNDSTMVGKSKTVCQGCRETYCGGFVAHHNTVIGFDNFLSRSNLYSENCVASIFDNLFVLNEGGLVCNEGRTFYSNNTWQTNNVVTSFKSGSFVRNNYVCELANINGGTLTEYEGYDFAKNVAIEGNLTTPEPVFESLDPANQKFCLMKLSKNRGLVGKNIAWTDDGKYPNYLGAVEPMVAGSMVIFVK